MKRFSMNKMTICLIVLFTSTLFSFSAAAQTRDEIVKGSYFLAFGRYPSGGEYNYWRQNIGNRSLNQMVENHRNYLRSNQGEKEKVVRQSYMDAFGWQPSADELRYWAGQNKTYSELMTNHVNNWLNVYRDKKELVIKQSYYKALNRAPSAAEVKYWMDLPTYTFVQLVATHLTWKQQNQPKSTSTPITSNINSPLANTAPITPELKTAMIAAGGGAVIAPGGGNVIAAGGGNVVSPGGGN